MIVRIVVDLLRGVAIGLANIIPGVSGGTMALILGIYERLITAIGNLGSSTLKAPFRGLSALKEELRRTDALLLFLLAVGALGIIVAVARVMPYLLDNQHDPTYGFFFGLVLVSVIVPYRMIKKKGVASIEELRDMALEADVKMIACQMTMDLFEYSQDDLIQGPKLGGAATYIETATKSDINLFI